MPKLTREDIATKIHRQYHPPEPRRVDGFGRVLEWEDETAPEELGETDPENLNEKIREAFYIVRKKDAKAIEGPFKTTKSADARLKAILDKEGISWEDFRKHPYQVIDGAYLVLDRVVGKWTKKPKKEETDPDGQELDERVNQSCFPKPNRSDPAAELAGWSGLAGAMVVAVPPKLRKAAQAFKKAVDFEFSHSDLYDDKEGDEGSLDEELLDEAKKGKLKKDIKLKTGDVIPAGTSVGVEFDRRKPERALLTLDFSTDNRDYTVDPLKMSAGKLYLYVAGFGKPPSIKTMMNWTNDGVAKSVTGKKVAPDGVGPDGSPSWLMVLGYI